MKQDFDLIEITQENYVKCSRKILVLYTGGTIGMAFDVVKNALVPFQFEQIPNNLPEIGRLNFGVTVLVMHQLLDSSNIGPKQWQRFAQIIDQYYQQYDGFVVLHGTDTMAFGASAVSFMLQNLAKPIIFTGAQLPIGMARTDAKENFITAMEIAADYKNERPVINEVCVYFNNKLLRANRSRKHESLLFNAFDSENYPVLAEIGVNIEYNYPYLRQNEDKKPYVFNNKLNDSIFILKLFPGINLSIIHQIAQIKELKGLIIETFGSGNAPTNIDFLEAVKKIIANEIIVYIVSQCIGGRVMQGVYETSKSLLDIGVVSGLDIIIEAAVPKLMFVLGQNLPYNEAIKMLRQSISGEISL